MRNDNITHDNITHDNITHEIIPPVLPSAMDDCIQSIIRACCGPLIKVDRVPDDVAVYTPDAKTTLQANGIERKRKIGRLEAVTGRSYLILKGVELPLKEDILKVDSRVI